ncbi:hypothetical protein [Poseidonocella sp. HB161398]|uniref:hypothetical protein n=1 Tax=Poseidonocella sp. HB161398 TaxID=2320855 RepID=UPI001109468B|nr:hypothetical protein [Poseidonocella sp. HB161398]
MTSRDAFDIACAVSAIYVKVLQFFIAICTLFGGWIIAGETVRALPVAGWERLGLIAIFLASAGSLALGLVQLARRSNAALEIGLALSQADGTGPEAARRALFRGQPVWPTGAATAIVMAVICLLTAFLQAPPS